MRWAALRKRRREGVCVFEVTGRGANRNDDGAMKARGREKLVIRQGNSDSGVHHGTRPMVTHITTLLTSAHPSLPGNQWRVTGVPAYDDGPSHRTHRQFTTTTRHCERQAFWQLVTPAAFWRNARFSACVSHCLRCARTYGTGARGVDGVSMSPAPARTGRWYVYSTVRHYIST